MSGMEGSFKRFPILLSAIFLSVSSGQILHADDLTYVGWGAPNLGWFAADAWEDGDQELTNWISGSSVTISSSSTGLSTSEIIDFTANTAAGDLSLTNNLTIRDTSATFTLSVDGAIINAVGGGRGAEFAGVKVVGDFTKTGSGILSFAHMVNANNNSFEGTATINGGSLIFNRLQNVMGPNSNFIVNSGGTLELRFSPSQPMGNLVINTGGTVSIGRTNADESYTVGMASLAGDGGTLFVQGRSSGSSPSPSVDNVLTLAVTQNTNTVYSGAIVGLWDNSAEPTRADRVIAFQKNGSGALTLDGSIELVREVTVSNGHLYINSAPGTAEFSSRTTATAISVNGGTLGGTGTITVTDGSSVVLSAAGKIAAGIEGAAGRTTYAFNGGTLNLSAATGSDTGWLKFDLGSAAEAGVSYDQILLTGGVLNIGSGLNFADFDFSLLSGFGAGTYVLFDTDAAIFGSLGDALGTLDGYDAELLIVGNDLVLQVIPEPTAVAMAFGCVVILVSLLRKRRVA